MNFRRLVLIAVIVSVGFLFATQGLYNAPVAKAHQDTKTGTTTGFPTGAICKKSGVYRAANKYIENVIVVAEGEEFPPFSDGTKTIWYLRSAKK